MLKEEGCPGYHIPLDLKNILISPSETGGLVVLTERDRRSLTEVDSDRFWTLLLVVPLLLTGTTQALSPPEKRLLPLLRRLVLAIAYSGARQISVSECT